MFAPTLPLTWLEEFEQYIAKHSSVATRGLSESEIAALIANGNRVAAKSWDDVRIRVEPGRAFDPSSVQRCTFVGAVELGTCCCGLFAHPPLTTPLVSVFRLFR